MQAIVFLIFILGIYALQDTSQTDLAAGAVRKADMMAKQMEYYHTQAVTKCVDVAVACPTGPIALTQLARSAWIYGTDITSATDGTYVVTTWKPRAGVSGIDAKSLFGNAAAVLHADTASSLAISGTYTANTASVSGGSQIHGLDSQNNGSTASYASNPLSLAIPSPFAGMAIADGAPVLVARVN